MTGIGARPLATEPRMDTADLIHWFFLATLGAGGLIFLGALAYGAQTVRESFALHGVVLA
jgi:hypothetical protein